ncbi:MAG: cellulose binding domain-containing protein [Clostridiales bacterium]
MKKVLSKKILSSITLIAVVITLTAIFITNINAAATVSYDISNDWGGGAVVNVTVQNTSSTPLSDWTVVWTFPGNQKISSMWNGEYTQNGSNVSVKGLEWNSTIQPNNSTSFGFQVTYSGSNSKPSDISVNGQVAKTEQPATEQPATEQPVTEQPVTEQPVTEQPNTPQNTPQDAQVADNGDKPIGFASLNGGTTGGKGGKVVTVTNQSDLEKYAGASEPYIVKVKGTITISPLGHEVNVNSNKTIVGVGSDATIKEGGLGVFSKKNVIIRNLTIRDSFLESDPEGDNNDYDGIQVDTSNNIWIDHCLITHCGDGVLDVRKNTSFMTVSWCTFVNNKRGPTFGWTDNTDFKVTMHHNWIKDMVMRNPVFDQGIGHFYNNLSENISKFGHQARGNARMLVENSYWDNVVNPYAARDSNSIIEVRGSIVKNSSGNQKSQGGTAFDPNSYYSYKLDATEDVPNIVKSNAGPNTSIQY